MHLGTLKPFLFTWSSSSPPPRPAAAAWPGQGCFDQWPDTGIISTSAACCCWPERVITGGRGPGWPSRGPGPWRMGWRANTRQNIKSIQLQSIQQYASKCNASLLPLIVLARLLSSLPGSWPWHLFHLCVCLPRKWSSLSHQIVTTLSATAQYADHYYPDTVCRPTSIALCGIK